MLTFAAKQKGNAAATICGKLPRRPGSIIAADYTGADINLVVN